jgi:uncharacterized membrane protein YfcA
MFSVYLPIAEMSVDVVTILLLGGVTGILSGMFGVGGGFLITPLLMFLGIPPAVAVASSANQIIASSVSGFMNHWRRGNVDFRMGGALLAGGLVGSGVGVWLFKRLQTLGHIDVTISLIYVVFLGIIGGLMLYESARTIIRMRSNSHHHAHHTDTQQRTRFIDRLPLRVHFPRSELHLSVLIPILIGVGVGILVSLMGIGGGFFLVPAMIYVLRMPAHVVVGTSLFQIIFVSANVTILQAITTHTVDIMLAMLLMVGSVFGAQLGIRIATKFSTIYLRALLALIVFSVAARLAYGLLATPSDIFSITLEAM